MLASVLLGLALAGCCDEEGRRRAGAQGTSTMPAEMGASVTDASVPGLTLTHASVEGITLQAHVNKLKCRAGRGAAAEVQVQWSSALPGLTFVQITAGSRTQVAKLWVEGGANGTETTGPWFEDGGELTLLDGTDRVIGVVRASATECTSDSPAAP
ncbi:hypothetical protein ORG27_09645 [Stenotrophomonas lactitubi]|jgi:hypothetical protein|uniref:hypothetical protein n=1 Tax=Stenotrophomonas lactitubi TaxID=2045214 RepID=UPI002248BBCB|nr:hypothetical protein [Stenotrophomonas lactitubi]MCX2893839.1 hypothetical protein [Stenotrophomonas lactitubi]